MKSKVLVIGGAGFIGSHVVDQLRAEPVSEIIIYDNFCRGSRSNIASSLADPRVRICEVGGDILQTDILRDAMKGCDYVFHLAALWLLQCHEYPRAAFDVNIGGTFNVLEACVAERVKRLVYSSSASVYGDAVTIPMTEEHPFNNRTFYGATKIAGEAMCRAFFERYGLKYVGLRYMNVYGERQDYRGAYTAVMMKILDRVDKGLPPIIHGDGSQAYDFIHVADVARANIAAMKSDAVDQCYNVGTGRKTSLIDLCRELLDITGAPPEIEFEADAMTFVTQRVGSAERAEREIGFRASVELRAGLERLVEWRREDKKFPIAEA